MKMNIFILIILLICSLGNFWLFVELINKNRDCETLKAYSNRWVQATKESVDEKTFDLISDKQKKLFDEWKNR